MTYRDWLYKKIDEELLKAHKSEVTFLGGQIISEIVEGVNQGKEVIKKIHESKLAKKEKVRRIESIHERTVHFLFNPGPGVKPKIAPFTRKYKSLIEGNLAEVEEKEAE